MSGLLREHDFRLLWFGQGISAMGSSVTAIVLPLIVVVGWTPPRSRSA